MHVINRQSNKLAIALSSKHVNNIDKTLKLVAKRCGWSLYIRLSKS